MYSGWTQVAFDSELDGDVVPVDLAGRRLVAVRVGGDVGVYDGTCPHRGAHLGHGGKLQVRGPGEASVVCPFHGHRVRLGCAAAGDERFGVARRPSVHAARGLFVLTDPECDTGLAEFLVEVERTHHIVEALTIRVPITPEYIIENAFDVDHFAAVHALERRPKLDVSTDSRAVLRVEGVFDMVQRNQWMPDGAPASTRFVARLFSPMLVVSELGPADEPNVVVTAATPADPATGGGSVVRVTIGLPRQRAAGPPTVREVASLVSGTRTAFTQDIAVWEHLDTSVTPRWTESDRLVRAYREHCERFRA